MRYPSRSPHWWKSWTRNWAVLETRRSFGRESYCEPKPQELALYILLTTKAFWNLNFGYFCKKQKRQSPYICIYGLCYFSFLSEMKFWHKLALLCWVCNYTQRLCWLHTDPAHPPCHFFLTCSCAISALNTAMMISYLLESVSGLKRFIPTLIKKTVITVTLEKSFFFKNKTKPKTTNTKAHTNNPHKQTNPQPTNHIHKTTKKPTHTLFCCANKIGKILPESSNDSTVYLNFKTHQA